MYILLTESGVADPAAGGTLGGTLMGTILYFAVILFVMWFFLIRPQNKEKKRLAAMVANMEVGDCVLTTSGFYGILIGIEEDTVIVEFGNNKNCRIPMEKSAIGRVEKAE